LPRMDESALRDLLGMAYKYVVSHPKHKRTFSRQRPGGKKAAQKKTTRKKARPKKTGS